MQALANSYTFGEAAWASQAALSWQTTVIGDPLYRPFGEIARKNCMRNYCARIIRWMNGPTCAWPISHSSAARAWPKLSELIENLAATTNSAVLTEKLADLYDAQGKPSSAILTYQKALDSESFPGTTHPSPAHAG